MWANYVECRTEMDPREIQRAGNLLFPARIESRQGTRRQLRRAVWRYRYGRPAARTGRCDIAGRHRHRRRIGRAGLAEVGAARAEGKAEFGPETAAAEFVMMSPAVARQGVP